jgi:GTP cyclohydrolase IB
MTLEDVQGRPDTRGIALDEVGVTGLRYQIVVCDRDGAKQDTIGQVTMAVALPADAKGAHLSRFVEVLHEHATEISVTTLPVILDALRDRLSAPAARLRVHAPYFRERHAPVSRARSSMGYDAMWFAAIDGDTIDVEFGVRVPVTSVCPCSKAISDYGAHNQRGHITIRVRPHSRPAATAEQLWLEDLIDLAERSASAPVFPLLKRPDERHVTMLAHDNPVFVEDMARNVAEQLRTDDRLAAFGVHAANEESIHDHAAFATIESPRPGSLLDTSWQQR